MSSTNIDFTIEENSMREKFERKVWATWKINELEYNSLPIKSSSYLMGYAY